MVSNMKKTVLLVDDNVLNLEINRNILANEGYIVYTAGDGSRGVRLTQKIDPDLILMDMTMPIMDGIDATKILRNKGYTGVIVAFTGGTISPDVIKEAGFNSIIEKPVIDTMEFLETLSNLIDPFPKEKM